MKSIVEFSVLVIDDFSCI